MLKLYFIKHTNSNSALGKSKPEETYVVAHNIEAAIRGCAPDGNFGSLIHVEPSEIRVIAENIKVVP